MKRLVWELARSAVSVAAALLIMWLIRPPREPRS